MKKLLAILVLGLLLSGSAYGSEIPQIKEKSLKCLHTDYKNKNKVNKENYLYLVFSGDRKRATMISPLKPDATYVYKDTFEVRTRLTEIIFMKEFGAYKWTLNRKTGDLNEWYTLEYNKHSYYGICDPVEKGFDPVRYMDNFVKQNIEKTKKELKF